MKNNVITAVIGGTGFLGSALVPALLIEGKKVLILGRKPRPESLDARVEYIQSNCLNTELLAHQLRNVSEILDLSYATTPKTSFDDPMTDLLTNLPRVISVFEASKNIKNLKRLMLISSGGTVYGKTTNSPITENFATKPISPYGITKLTLEKYAAMYQELYGLPIIIVRPSNCYGPRVQQNESQGFINICISRAFNKEVITVFSENGTIRDYIYVSDLVDALVQILEVGEIGSTYNIGTGVGFNNIKVLELLDFILIPLNIKIKYKTLPARSFDVPSNILDYGLLSKHTGWKPKVELLEGLQKTLQWFQDTQR